MTSLVIALDSSVVVACFGAWHEHHEVAAEMLDHQPRLPAHAALEAYSVLTRLPDPFRAEPGVAAEFLRRAFPPPRLTLEADRYHAVPTRLAELDIAGGAVYDALIGMTVQHAGAELVTLDRRALGTYRRVAVATRMLAADAEHPRDTP